MNTSQLEVGTIIKDREGTRSTNYRYAGPEEGKHFFIGTSEGCEKYNVFASSLRVLLTDDQLKDYDVVDVSDEAKAKNEAAKMLAFRQAQRNSSDNWS